MESNHKRSSIKPNPKPHQQDQFLENNSNGDEVNSYCNRNDDSDSIIKIPKKWKKNHLKMNKFWQQKNESIKNEELKRDDIYSSLKDPFPKKNKTEPKFEILLFHIKSVKETKKKE
jgi:hypothetical protein